MTRATLTLAALLFAAGCLPLAAQAQERGQVGLSLKGQLYPHAGLYWQATDRIALRGSIYAVGGGESALDISDSFMLSFAGLYHWRIDDALSSYAGADLAFFEIGGDAVFLGPLYGAQYRLHPRFSVFGEVGLSFAISEGNTMQMFNTGAGIVFFFGGS